MLNDYDHELSLSAVALALSRSAKEKGLKVADILKKPSILKDIEEGRESQALPATLSNYLKQSLSNSFITKCREDLKRWEEAGIYSLSLGSDKYPSHLAEIHDAPPILFFRAKRRDLIRILCSAYSVAIVGSRKADMLGCNIASELGRGCAEKGITVVSGLALGVDGAAHQGALKAQAELPTVAVLGNGLNSVYPRAHEHLAHDLINSDGIILSQFEPEERPYPNNFLNRNRVIAGLSKGVIVVQAGTRSGSLVTARYAMEEGREVFVIPGAINSKLYEGSNTLIRQGAILTRKLDDVLTDLPAFTISETQSSEDKQKDSLPAAQQEIIEKLHLAERLPYSELERSVKQSGQFAQNILELELLGHIIREPGNQIALKAQLN